MRRLWVLAVLVPLVFAACGSSDTTIEQDEVGSTQAAVAATPTGVANCGAHFPVPRRMSQYVNLVESDALPAFIANPIDSGCRLAVATLIESVPECASGTPEDQAKVARHREPRARPDRVGRPARPGVRADPRRRPRAGEPQGMLKLTGPG